MNGIFITGAGIISALGEGKVATLDALRQHRTGITAVCYLNTLHTEFPVGEVKQSNAEMMETLRIPSTEAVTRTSLMGKIAMREALTQAQLHDKQEMRVALLSGITVGGMDMSELFYPTFLSDNTKNDYIAMHECGTCTEMLADHFGRLFSYTQTISTACSSAANAVMMGAELIRSGRTDVAVVGGCECITKYHLNGFNALMILDREQCKPFDAKRNGLNLGEGAAYLVLEGEATMRRRQVQPLCRLAGYANTCDAFHQTASSPDGEGAYLAMVQALQSANLNPSDINYINAHGTGTDNNDLSEGLAMQRLFGDNMPQVSSTKAFTGHTTSAAGGVEAVISMLALQHNFIPVNLNFSTKMEELSFAPSTDETPRKPLCNVLSNSFGFGGNDTSLILSKL